MHGRSIDFISLKIETLSHKDKAVLNIFEVKLSYLLDYYVAYILFLWFI
jgi:hypothetical protein